MTGFGAGRFTQLSRLKVLKLVVVNLKLRTLYNTVLDS